MHKNRLDARDMFPSGMEEYLNKYGWHFSKKLAECAAKKMTKDDKPIMPYTKEEVESLLQRNNISLKNDVAYDCLYVANMAKADYWGSSIADEMHIAKFIKDYIDDSDGYDGMPMTRYYADCIGKGEPIMWEDVI